MYVGKSLNGFIEKDIPRELATRGYSLPMNVRAIRGATQVSSNDPISIGEGSKELLTAILVANDVSIDDVISVLLTSSPDLNAAFPASAAREIGFQSVPLLCAQEIDVPGALPRTIRVMLHCNSLRSTQEIEHIYLHGASILRKDLAQ
ncbi:unannotated protein [freshwater metagenome]|uniref:Unannotated protein n=1 Tax=freshwater metagenome TaxID=449393 RepID=A0A6J6YR44_9ZZZZ